MGKEQKNRQPTHIGQLPEFRYNHRRRHYSYIFGRKKSKYKNLLLSSKPNENKNREGRTVVYDNVKLTEHPNPNKKGESSYVMNRVYLDSADDFDNRKRDWKFHPFDRRKIKRIRKSKWK